MSNHFSRLSLEGGGGGSISVPPEAVINGALASSNALSGNQRLVRSDSSHVRAVFDTNALDIEEIHTRLCGLEGQDLAAKFSPHHLHLPALLDALRAEEQRQISGNPSLKPVFGDGKRVDYLELENDMTTGLCSCGSRLFVADASNTLLCSQCGKPFEFECGSQVVVSVKREDSLAENNT